MVGGGKTCWRAVQVHGRGADGDAPRELTAADRLAALYRFQNGEVCADHALFTLVDGRRRVEVRDPADVDWRAFPLVAALEAVSRDELRRLRHLLGTNPEAFGEEDTPPPTSCVDWVFTPLDKPAALG